MVKHLTGFRTALLSVEKENFLKDLQAVAASWDDECHTISLELMRQKYSQGPLASMFKDALESLLGYWSEPIRKGWYSGFMAGWVRNQNGLEGQNKWVKRDVTKHKLLALIELLDAAFDWMRHRSKRYDHFNVRVCDDLLYIRMSPCTDTIKLGDLEKAYIHRNRMLNTKSVPTMQSFAPVVWVTVSSNICKKDSEGCAIFNLELITAHYEQFLSKTIDGKLWASFDDYLFVLENIFAVQKFRGTWVCTCPFFCTELYCNHSIQFLYQEKACRVQEIENRRYLSVQERAWKTKES